MPKLDADPVNITPIFSVGMSPDDQAYGSAPLSSQMSGRWMPYHEVGSVDKPVELWRLEDRDRVVSGLGLVSSRALLESNVGSLDDVRRVDHLASNFESRRDGINRFGKYRPSPFISFSANPRHLAEKVIIRHGFGLNSGRDSVVLRAQINQDRLVNGLGSEEVLLWGALSPSEYMEAYEIDDFIAEHMPENGEFDVVGNSPMTTKEALKHWRGY